MVDEGTERAKRDRRTSRLAVNKNKFSTNETREQLRSGFKKQTGGFSVAAQVLLAGRAALRVLPFHVSLLSVVEDEAPSDFQEILRRLRCHITSTIASLRKVRDQVLFDRAAGSARINLPNELWGSAELASMYAISAAALASEQRAKKQASYALAYSVWGYEGSNYARSAIEKDINALGSSGELKYRRFLVARPLWPSVQLGAGEIQAGMELDENRFDIPQSIYDSWLSLKKYLVNAGNDWDVWVDWYEGILHGETNGKYLFDLPTDDALKLWRNVALIDVAIWKAGPATLNAEFKRLVEEARRDVGSSHVRHSTQEINSKQTQNSYSIQARNNEQLKSSLASKIGEFKDLHDEIDGYFVELDRNLDAHIEAANSELQKLTDIDTRQPWREEIERLELLRSLTTELRAVVKELSEGRANIDEAKETVGKFREGLENWWQKRHVQVLDKAFNFGLNATGFSVYMIVGSAVGLVAGAPYIGMLCGAAAYSGKDALNKVINKAMKITN